MKKIKDFKEGDRIKDVYLVKEVKNGTTAKGSPYLTVVLQDNSGMMEAKFWDVKEEDRQLIQTGRFVCFSFDSDILKNLHREGCYSVWGK